MDISYYLKIIYTKNNQEYPFLNCWGLVCEYYKQEKNITLDLFKDDDLFSINSKYLDFRTKLTEISKPAAGVIVAFFKKDIIKHVGIYLSSERILHTDRITRIQSLKEIVKVKNYSGVKFYDAL